MLGSSSLCCRKIRLKLGRNHKSLQKTKHLETMRQGRKTGHNIIFQRAIDFKDSIFRLRFLINSYFTPRVEQIACVS